MAVETMESAPATISAANATVAGSSLPFSFSPRQQTQLHDRLNSSRRSRLHEGKSHASPRRKEVPLSLVGLLVTAVLGLLLGFFKLHQCRQQALKTNSETEGTILRRLAEGGHEENDCIEEALDDIDSILETIERAGGGDQETLEANAEKAQHALEATLETIERAGGGDLEATVETLREAVISLKLMQPGRKNREKRKLARQQVHDALQETTQTLQQTHAVLQEANLARQHARQQAARMANLARQHGRQQGRQQARQQVWWRQQCV